MRIVGGKYRHRIITWPDDAAHIRPTKDRVREAIFSALNYIEGFTVLDLYSGSGAMGIEAISRGAKSTYFVDKNPVAINTTKKNIKDLGITEENHVLKNTDFEALEYFKNNNISFDLIILDPPYALGEYKKVIDYIFLNNLIKEKGIIVCESNYHLDLDDKNYIKDKEYNYGEIKVRILWR